MHRTILALSLVLASFGVMAKEQPKAYDLVNKADQCKQGFHRVEVESVKVAKDGSVTFKYIGSAPMGPVPKQHSAPFLKMKAGDIQCLPGSIE